MLTIEKKYSFLNDSEGWSAETADPSVHASWYKLHHQHNRWNGILIDPLASMRGCLRTTSKHISLTQNNWQLSSTWLSLGVPSGGLVRSVRADYIYRFDFAGTHRGGRNRNLTYITDQQFGTGPFELRNADDDLIGTFSQRVFCPARTEQNNFAAYPIGTNFDAVTEIPVSWGVASGEVINVPEEYQLPSQQIIFKLNNLMPVIPVPIGEERNFARLKQDRIVLTINYELLFEPESNVFFKSKGIKWKFDADARSIHNDREQRTRQSAGTKKYFKIIRKKIFGV